MILPLLAAVTLSHKFHANEKLAYQILSHITSEHRGRGLDTWIPEDLDVNYNFTAQVTQMRQDGIAVFHYLRPTVTGIEGETAEAPPQTHVDPVNIDSMVTISPINEVLEEKTKPTPAGTGHFWFAHSGQGAAAFFGPFIADVHRLALFIGGVQDSLDFAPKLPLNPVNVGDTWKHTVGFQPQRIKDKEGKSAVQRLDYTYTYLGPMQSNGKQILRVEAKLTFVTDLGAFLKQELEDRSNETDVDKLALHFDATIDFDLDPTSCDTLRAEGHSEGGYQVFLKTDPTIAVEEEKFKGRTTMDLAGKRT